MYIRTTVEIENNMSKITSPPPPFVKAVTENWGSVQFHVKKARNTHTVFGNGIESTPLSDRVGS